MASRLRVCLISTGNSENCPHPAQERVVPGRLNHAARGLLMICPEMPHPGFTEHLPAETSRPFVTLKRVFTER